MAELDYAFLAEYAKVEVGGNLTAIGASYTHISVPRFPSQHLVSIAGRVRSRVGEQPLLKASFRTPDRSVQLDFELQLAATPEARPYGPEQDTLGLQFAVSFAVPLPTSGLYDVDLQLDGRQVRTSPSPPSSRRVGREVVRIRPTTHFRNQMARRGVTWNDVNMVLDHPGATWPNPKNASVVYHGTGADGRTLHVCLVDPTPADGVPVGKTVFWTT